MQIIPTRLHGVIDYLTGILLVAAPWLFGFATGGAAQWVTVVLGLVVIVYSVFTDYELGLVRLIPFPMHLMLDMGLGVVLILSPWIFGFADIVVWPHLVIGAVSIIVPMLTVRHPAGASLRA